MKTLLVLFVTIFMLGFTTPNNDQTTEVYPMVIVQLDEDGSAFFYETIQIESTMLKSDGSGEFIIIGEPCPASDKDAKKHVADITNLDEKTIKSFSGDNVFNVTVVKKDGKETITKVIML